MRRNTKRPSVEIGDRTFVAGDSYLVVYQHGQVADLREWQSPKTRHRPRSISGLQDAALEWLREEKPAELAALFPPQEFWGI